MEYYSALPDLINSMAKHIPESERDVFARKASECLSESLDLSVWFNQLATGYDKELGDIDVLSTGLNYINLTLTELSHVSNNLKQDIETDKLLSNRTKATLVPVNKAQGGAR